MYTYPYPLTHLSARQGVGRSVHVLQVLSHPPHTGRPPATGAVRPGAAQSQRKLPRLRYLACYALPNGDIIPKSPAGAVSCHVWRDVLADSRKEGREGGKKGHLQRFGRVLKRGYTGMLSARVTISGGRGEVCARARPSGKGVWLVVRDHVGVGVGTYLCM